MIYSINAERIDICFNLNPVHSELQVDCLEQQFEKTQTQPNAYSFTLDTVPPLCRFLFSGKTSVDTIFDNGQIVKDATFAIGDVWINGILLQNWAFKNFCQFYPDYDYSQREFATINNIDLPNEITNTLTYFCNGRLEIQTQNFFVNYHKITLASLDQYNHWVKKSHLGIVDPELQKDLLEIFKSL